MTTHDLKCWPLQFEDILEGKKTFELRFNDRDYKIGDTLRLREYVPSVMEANSLTEGNMARSLGDNGYFTGRETLQEVVGGAVGGDGLYRSVLSGFLIMSLKPIEVTNSPRVPPDHGSS